MCLEERLAEGESFTSIAIAILYRILFILYRDLVPCFVIARGVSKKLEWIFQFHFQR